MLIVQYKFLQHNLALLRELFPRSSFHLFLTWVKFNLKTYLSLWPLLNTWLFCLEVQTQTLSG